MSRKTDEFSNYLLRAMPDDWIVQFFFNEIPFHVVLSINAAISYAA